MKPGESFVGQPIRSLQTMLRTIAQVDPKQISVIPDGVYSYQTADAVRSFQENHGISPTGTVDNGTWDRIVEVFRPAQIETTQAAPVYITLNPGRTFRKGDTSQYVDLIQAMLRLFSRVFAGFPVVELTGIYDDKTEEAVVFLQVLSTLPATGILDKQTWKHLVLHYGNAGDILSRREE